jgi:hypothetical protein
MVYVDMVIMASMDRLEEFPVADILAYHKRVSIIYSSKHYQRDRRRRNDGHYSGVDAEHPKNRRNKQFKPPTKDFTFEYLAFRLRPCPIDRLRTVLPELCIPYGFEVDVPRLSQYLRRASSNFRDNPRGDFWIPFSDSVEDKRIIAQRTDAWNKYREEVKITLGSLAALEDYTVTKVPRPWGKDYYVEEDPDWNILGRDWPRPQRLENESEPEMIPVHIDPLSEGDVVFTRNLRMAYSTFASMDAPYPLGSQHAARGILGNTYRSLTNPVPDTSDSERSSTSDRSVASSERESRERTRGLYKEQTGCTTARPTAASG